MTDTVCARTILYCDCCRSPRANIRHRAQSDFSKVLFDCRRLDRSHLVRRRQDIYNVHAVQRELPHRRLLVAYPAGRLLHDQRQWGAGRLGFCVQAERPKLGRREGLRRRAAVHFTGTARRTSRRGRRRRQLYVAEEVAEEAELTTTHTTNATVDRLQLWNTNSWTYLYVALIARVLHLSQVLSSQSRRVCPSHSSARSKRLCRCSSASRSGRRIWRRGQKS